jgi:lambda repressor-like predicted transcriptional regulator
MKKQPSCKLSEPMGETRNIVAKFVGVGERTLSKAKERQRFLSNEETISSVNLTEMKGNTLDKISGFVGVSRNTLKKAEVIVKAAEDIVSILLGQKVDYIYL